MDGITAYLAIAATTIVIAQGQPFTARLTDDHVQRQEDRVDGIRVNGVIYYDAPIRIAPLIVR